MASARETFRRMATITAKSAKAEGAMLLSAGELSRQHDACSAEPIWPRIAARGAPNCASRFWPNLPAAYEATMTDVVIYHNPLFRDLS
jgi:hypothetical protein